MIENASMGMLVWEGRAQARKSAHHGQCRVFACICLKNEARVGFNSAFNGHRLAFGHSSLPAHQIQQDRRSREYMQFDQLLIHKTSTALNIVIFNVII